MFDLKSKLQKTRDGFVSPLKKLFQRGPKVTEKEQDEIEELLLSSDMGVEASERIMDSIREQGETRDYRTFLREEFLRLLADTSEPAPPPTIPRAILIIGINGVGKTTSIAKLANHYKSEGKKVLLAAADTFRAAAQDQLGVWAKQIGIDMVAHKPGGDPAAVAFDACNAAKSRGMDYVIIDTAGRMHTRVNLMEELKKIKRSCEKVLGPDSVVTYVTLDATLGQNSLHQAKEFTRSLHVDGIILTKLDSTAKGGIVLAIKDTLGVPVRYIGAGEGVDDFSEFDAQTFIDALLG